ncbi:MAG: hypothetical protein Q9208_004186 [Pyrenodesmia sp. 3 TL-2023]
MLSPGASEVPAVDLQARAWVAEINGTTFHELSVERDGLLVELGNQDSRARNNSDNVATPQHHPNPNIQDRPSTEAPPAIGVQVVIPSYDMSALPVPSIHSEGTMNRDGNLTGHPQAESTGATEHVVSGSLATVMTTDSSPQVQSEPDTRTDAPSSAGLAHSHSTSRSWMSSDEELIFTTCAEMLHTASDKDEMESILLYACQHGAVRIVDQLLRLGVDVHCHVKQAKHYLLGPTAIHIAVMHGQLEAAKTLLRHGALANEEGHDGRRPLHHAARIGDFNITALLLEHGARPDLPARNGMEPLHVACQSGSLKVARLLLDAGASIEAADDEGCRPLHCLALHRRDPYFAAFLVNLGCDLGSRNNQGFSPLQLACMCGNDRVLEVLLHHDMSFGLEQWSTMPLALAVSGNHQTVARLLLKSGAEIDRACPSSHRTILHLAAESLRCDRRSGDDPGGHQLVELLCKYGAAVNAQDTNGDTPLHVVLSTSPSSTAIHHQRSLVKCLISRGARADIPNRDGVYPLTLASRNLDLSIFRHVLAASMHNVPDKHLARIDREMIISHASLLPRFGTFILSLRPSYHPIFILSLAPRPLHQSSVSFDIRLDYPLAICLRLFLLSMSEYSGRLSELCSSVHDVGRAAAALTAAFVALVYLLCNVYEYEIAAFFAIHPFPPRLLRRVDPEIQLSPFGNPPFGISPAVAPEPGAPESVDAPPAEAGGDVPSILPLPHPSNSDSSPSASDTTGDAPSTPTDSGSNDPSDLPVPDSTDKDPIPTTAPPTPTATSSSTSSTPTTTLVHPSSTDSIPHSHGIDEYHLYTGNGSIAAGWPHKADWMSYEDMFTANLPIFNRSCAIWDVSPNTPAEISSIHNATLRISNETNTDSRFILAVILQESGGCVRVPTSFYSSRNPGLMQSHNGPATCNEDATPVVPCPYVTIEEMIREGTAGTSYDTGMGLVIALRQAVGAIDDVARYYRAARIYNSGSVDPSGDLMLGVATHCYASDIANRLRGWVLADDGCDGPGKTAMTEPSGVVGGRTEGAAKAEESGSSGVVAGGRRGWWLWLHFLTLLLMSVVFYLEE